MQPPQAPWYFRGVAPMAARRARPVQRGNHQGLPGDRHGPPEARMRLSRNPKKNRAWMHARFLPCLYSFPPPGTPVLGGAGGIPPGPFFPPISSGRNGGPGRAGLPRQGAPRRENGEPLIRPSVRTGAPSPHRGEGWASGGWYPPLRKAGEPSCRGRRPERSRTARRGRRAPRAGDSGGGGILSTPTGQGSYPPAGQAPPYPSSSRSTCPAERAKSRAAARASWRVLPWVPTSTSTEPVDSCWLYREERMVMGRARVG